MKVMENIHNDYPYLKLDATQDEIRLLELLPRGSDSSAPLQGRLIHRSLKQSPKYDALSYVWGSTAERTTIRLGSGRDYVVTKNLERALRDVSHFSSRQNEVLVIWVDAISINQRDFKERNAQVKMMWRIYAQAEKVRTWLDAEIPDQVVEALLQLCTNPQSVDDLGPNYEFWEPVAQIAENPYWDRVWVQQEVAYANDQVIHCHHIPLPHACLVWFYSVLDMYIDKYGSIMEYVEAAMWRGFAARSGPFLENKSMSVTNHRYYKNIYDALASTSHLKASDVRDRMYGLLALIEDDIDYIEVSYELSALETYCQVVQLLIQKYHSLIFLNIGGLNVSQEHFSLPTWLPYPRRHPTGILGRSSDIGSSEFAWHQSLLSPISHSPAILPFFSTDHKILHVHGMCISKVDDVCRHMSWQGEHRMGNFLLAWDEYLNKWASINNEINRSLTKVDAMKSFIRTMHICRTSGAVIHFMDQCLARFEKYFPMALAEQLKETPNLSESMRQFDYVMWGEMSRIMAIASLNRYLVLTQNGITGLAPLATMPGDEIWMLFRHPIPIVLRQEDKHFLVVGPAFIDFEIQEKWDEAMAKYKEGDQECRGREIRCITLR